MFAIFEIGMISFVLIVAAGILFAILAASSDRETDDKAQMEFIKNRKNHSKHS